MRHRGAAHAGAIAVVAFAVLAAGSPPGAASGCDRTAARNRYGTWTSVSLPAMPAAPVDPEGTVAPGQSTRNVLFSYAVDPGNGSTIYVADEWTIMRSVDAGCTWSATFSVLDHAGLSPHTDHIVSLTATARGGEGRVYALMRHGAQWFSDRQLSASSPRLAVLDRSGRWAVREPVLAGSGAPLAGEAGRLWITRGARGVMYMRVNDFANTGPALYASEDEGRTWEPRGARDFLLPSQGAVPTQTCIEASACTGVDYRALAVDPLDPNVLWSATFDGLLKSDDGGRTWRNVYTVDWRVALVDVFHRLGKPARIAAFGEHEAAWSSDGGDTWRAVTLPKGRTATAAASGSIGETVYVNADGRAHIATRSGARDISLPAHGGPSEELPEHTRLRDVTYAPAARSYFFLGGDNRDGRAWFGKSIVTFTPSPGPGDRS